MRTGENYKRLFTLLHILKEESDEEHILSMPALLLRMQDEDLNMERRTLYAGIHVLQENGYPIHFKRAGKQTGYYYKHDLSCAEALILSESILGSYSLSRTQSKRLNEKILCSLSKTQRACLPVYLPKSKTGNESVLGNIEFLLGAIREGRAVDFLYFDLSPRRKRTYRKQNKRYHLFPYAVLSDNGTYYCVLYSENHRSFGNYRIDKMDDLKMMEPQEQSVPFDRESWISNSFQMYAGEPTTITIRCPNELANTVFERFGEDIIISRYDEETFTASFHSAITPTLTAWLLQFYDRMEVLSPRSLIDDLLKIAHSITKTYTQDKEDPDHV